MLVEDLVAAYGERLKRLSDLRHKMKDPPEESSAEAKLLVVLTALDEAIVAAESIDLAPLTVHMGTDDGTVPLCRYGGYPAGDHPVAPRHDGKHWTDKIPTRFCQKCCATHEAIHGRPYPYPDKIQRTAMPVIGAMPNYQSMWDEMHAEMRARRSGLQPNAAPGVIR